METSDLFKQVVQHIGEYLETDVTHLKPDSRVAYAVPGLDSFKLFEMLLYLEDSFGIEFEDSVIEKITSMQDFVDHIEFLLAKKAGKV
jgi:acyl carrier protein